MLENSPARLLLFSGSSNRALSEEIARGLGTNLGKLELKRFSDGEIFVEVKENVRGADVYVIQSTCAPVNDHLLEILIIADALKRASVNTITAVVPYYGYARQDRKVAPRTPISAKLVADLFRAVGVDRVVSMDLHSGQIQGFFDIPFDNLFARPVLLDCIQQNLPTDNLVIVSPDAGGMERARAYAKKIDARVAMIDKRRSGPNVAKAMNLVGEVEGAVALIVDDMIDTAGTLTEAAETLMEHGAKEVYACACHGVLSGPAIQRIRSSVIKKVILTNTIPLRGEALECDKLLVVSVAGLLAETIRRIHYHDSVSQLFD